MKPKAVVGLVLISILVTSAIWYVFAQTPSETFWISPGTYPGAPAYTVWRDGSNYFSKGIDGELAYSGTNATEIIQNSIDAAYSTTNTGSVYLQAGTYDLSGALILNNQQLYFYGESGTGFRTAAPQKTSTILRQLTVTAPVLQVSHDGNHIENMMLYSEVNSPVVNVTADNLYVNNAVLWQAAFSVALRLNPDTYFNKFTNCQFYGSVELNGNTTDGVNDNQFENILHQLDFSIAGQVNALLLSRASGNSFLGYTIQSWSGYTAIRLNLSLSNRNHFYGLFFDNGETGVTDIDISSGSDYNLFFLINTESIAGEIAFVDNATGNSFVDRGFLILPKTSHPTTTGWADNEKARSWFCQTHNVTEYWNGTSILTP